MVAQLPDHAADLPIFTFFKLDHKAVAGKAFYLGGPGFITLDNHARPHIGKCFGCDGQGRGNDILFFMVKGRVE